VASRVFQLKAEAPNQLLNPLGESGKEAFGLEYPSWFLLLYAQIFMLKISIPSFCEASVVAGQDLF
jgi:hypothetical protein